MSSENALNIHAIEDKLTKYFSQTEEAKAAARDLISSATAEVVQYCGDCAFCIMDVKSDNITTGYSCSHPIYTYCDDKSIKLWLMDEKELIENNWLCPRPEQCPIYLVKQAIGTRKVILTDNNLSLIEDLINEKFPFTLDKTPKDEEIDGTQNTQDI